MDDAVRRIRYPFEAAPGPGEAIEIADGILWARLPLPMALDHVNVYALDDGDGWTIVDTGVFSGRTRTDWQALLDGPLAGKPVTRVIVTHHHPDHIGAAGWFVTDHGADLVTTRTAWLFARMLALDVHTALAPETERHYRRAGMEPEMLAAKKAERPFNFADILAPLPLGFTRIREGDTLHAAGRDWTVHTGNGHAPEHATLWAADGGLVIGGDQLLPSISPNLGVYATEPEADPVAEWLVSCQRFRDMGDDDRLVLPGHKLPYTGLRTRMDQLIENHRTALDRLEEFLAEPRTACDAFQVLFRRKIGAGEYTLALVEAMAHCLHLWHAGRVTRTLRDDGAWLWQATGVSPA